MGASGFHLKCPCEHHFLMCEQVEGFGLPFKMSLRATIPLVGGSGKLQKDMGTYIWQVFKTYRFLIHRTIKNALLETASASCLSRLAVTSFSRSGKDSGNTFHPECPCERHFFMWEQVESFRLPLKMPLRTSFSHLRAS